MQTIQMTRADVAVAVGQFVGALVAAGQITQDQAAGMLALAQTTTSWAAQNGCPELLNYDLTSIAAAFAVARAA